MGNLKTYLEFLTLKCSALIQPPHKPPMPRTLLMQTAFWNYMRERERIEKMEMVLNALHDH